MNAEWGASRWNDSKGMLKLEAALLKPDERRIELYNHVKRYCEDTADLPAKECVQYAKELNEWALVNKYPQNELNKMRVSIRG